ncbi:MAG TPA: response regulator [bacterium]|jgi:DNA-binding NtrC family response regulator|nr:response regulator [bacterium]HNW15771.1 response regulator [bacterium]HOB72662.1 response regulator [bacterium]HOG43948.1 response regulator [bacterium]HPA56940.1 response regulator [bacterium]
MDRKNITILILDDEENILSSLKRILEGTGYTVVTKNKPEDAVDFVRNNVVHIALVDVLMPNMDGITVLNIVKEISGLTQVIMMSAYSTIDRIVSALENGANDFLLKPFDNIELFISIVEESEKKLLRWQDILSQTGAI